MSTSEYGSVVNLADLRDELANRLALWLAGLSWLGLLYAAFFRGRFATISLLISLLALGIGVRILMSTRPTLARHLLIWGLTAGLIAMMWLFSNPWLPFLGLLLTFTGAMLVSGGGVATVAAIAGVATWLTYSQERAYPLPDLFIALMLGVIMTWLSLNTLYTALQWTWTMNQRANRLLSVVRDQQIELKRTVKSLEQVNALQRRTQRELVLARKRAEEARRVTEQFAANISHELRTPLNLILGFSEMMQLSPEVYGEIRWPPKLRQAVYQIYRSSRHLMEMIDDILDLSRFDIGGGTLNYEPTPLKPLLWDTVRMVEDFFRGHHVRLEVEIPEDLPTLDIDRTRIRQVLLNLLNNARRFTEEGVVRLEAKRTDGEVVISISDTGPGIPADKLTNIFKEFYQVDRSLHRSHGGTGLGLAICKRFVEAHQGRIWVESQEGVGSTFYFTLPISDQHIPVSPLQVAQPVDQLWSEMHRPILVVDSDPAVAALVHRYVGKYKVIQVEDANRLAEEIMLHHPRAVVVNVPPGKRNGHDTIVSVSVPFIECSLPSLAWVADNLAVVTCLTKPVTADQLLREIKRLESVHEVLIVDDEHGFCQLVERMLETTGQTFNVRYTYNGGDALRAMRTRRPDLVLLDLVMPGLNGFQVLEEMRREPELADIPVILLTGTSFIDDVLAQRSSPIVISRPDGLQLNEVLRCLLAVVDVLEPRYDEQSMPEAALVMREA
jgi:signal transduction histidine kinase/CheY-like chemotaxis protein